MKILNFFMKIVILVMILISLANLLLPSIKYQSMTDTVALWVFYLGIIFLNAIGFYYIDSKEGKFAKKGVLVGIVVPVLIYVAISFV